MASPTAYLQPDDYAAFGVSDASDSQINEATQILNGYLGAPEGLLWAPDANGEPAWMAAKSPTRVFTLASPIAAGANVQVSFPGASFGNQTIGEVVVIDRATPGTAEACVVTAATGNTLTLAAVQFAHSASVKVEFGLTLMEELSTPYNRSIVRTSRPPIVKLLSGYGRYNYGRRSQQITGFSQNVFLLASVGAFGGPPTWSQFSVSECDINFNTGEVWIPPGFLQAGFSEVRLHYVAGYDYASLPTAIKQATATTVRNFIDYAVSGNVKMLKAGDGAVEFFASSALSDDAQALISPFKVRLMA